MDKALSTFGTLTKSVEAHQTKLGQLEKDLKGLKALDKGREFPSSKLLMIVMLDPGPVSCPNLKGESQVKTSQMGTDRRSRSKVRVRVIGSSSMAWVEIFEGWGANIEAVVVDILDQLKDIRHLLTSMPAITTQSALMLPPLGPWDGCLVSNLSSP